MSNNADDKYYVDWRNNLPDSSTWLRVDRIHNSLHAEAFNLPTATFRSMLYPVASHIRWDNIPSNNNEDLFCGVLYDYSAIDNMFADNVGQNITFGVSTNLDGNVTTTASYRGVYRSNGLHEAHICVGDNQIDSRKVNVAIKANKEEVTITVPLTLEGRYAAELPKNPVAGMLVHLQECEKFKCLLVYTGETWKKVLLGELND